MSAADLDFLQRLREAEFSELILVPLLTRMGYTQVRYTHGVAELGKDIVFSTTEPLSGRKHSAVVVKNCRLSGAVTGNSSMRAVLHQVQQALDTPFLDPLDGNQLSIDTVYVITPFAVSQQAIASIRGALHQLSTRVRFIDGPALMDLIRQYYPSLLASLPETLPPLPKDDNKQDKTGHARTAFVLMPFKNPYDSYFAAIFKPALKKAGYKVSRADDLFTPHPIIKDIQHSIKSADLILCEMSEKNPNVFYELGLAHAIGKPAILVSQSEEDIPFDLRHIRVVFYNYRNAGWEAKLRKDIAAAAAAIKGTADVWPPPLT